LHRVYDLCTPRGLEDLCAACRDSGYEPDPGGILPVELLSIKVRTEQEEVFNLAYDRCTVRQAKRFSVYQASALARSYPPLLARNDPGILI
jgi:hypothetical protein